MCKKAYVAYNMNKDIVKKSSSGGMFYTITEFLFDKYNKIKIYGCVLNDKLEAVHIGTNNREKRDEMCGSKYISSKLGICYQRIMEDLLDSEMVVFTGTPCQVFGLIKYLEKNHISTEKLLTIDFICHGVANQKFFYDYIKFLEKKYSSEAVRCNFRSKITPQKLQQMKVDFENGKQYIASTAKFDWFYSVYQKKLCINQACFQCKHATQNRMSDFTLSDGWGYATKECFSPSIIICNSEKANLLFSQLKNKLVSRELRLDEIKHTNYYQSTTKPDEYDRFNEIYNQDGYLAAQKYVGNNTLSVKIKSKLADIIYSMEVN